MAGVRLGHDTARNQTVVLFHPVKRYKNGPYLCPKCGTAHVFKSYHLDFDDQGTTIVSIGVFNALRELGLPGLTIMGEVLKPPPQHLSMGGQTIVGELVTAEEFKRGNRLSVLKNKIFAPRIKQYE